jgi:uncharacterized protein YfaP (DUF2135 family)/uncharacterized protein YfaT (DUF1175 family)
MNFGKRELGRKLCMLMAIIATPAAMATPSKDPNVLKHRGTFKSGTGTEVPRLTLDKPFGGWTTSRMLEISGRCSDPTADPLVININGSRYYVRAANGAFSRKFPASPGRNSIAVECRNAAGTARVEKQVDAKISPVRLKVVLTSDTDGVYTDLHIYEPDGTHVYWASTTSPTGGLFFLNSEGSSFDQPGYGPYIYLHPAPPIGVFRIATNYWPGGATQHTLATLDLVIDEGLPTEKRRRVQRPLATPGETQDLAYITFGANLEAPTIFVPGQDDEKLRPKNIPKAKDESNGDAANYRENRHLFDDWFLSPKSVKALRESVVNLALQQARKISPAFDPAQRDCAGLVRFAYREAIGPRTALQRQRLRLPQELPLPGVNPTEARRAGWPLLWESALPRQQIVKASTFADAETLLALNFRAKGRDWRSAEPGDLLYYHRDSEISSPAHLMIYAGSSAFGPIVVYHNGNEGNNGEIRIVKIDSLMTEDSKNWRPSFDNKNFLGVYEWKRIPAQTRSI